MKRSGVERVHSSGTKPRAWPWVLGFGSTVEFVRTPDSLGTLTAGSLWVMSCALRWIHCHAYYVLMSGSAFGLTVYDPACREAVSLMGVKWQIDCWEDGKIYSFGGLTTCVISHWRVTCIEVFILCRYLRRRMLQLSLLLLKLLSHILLWDLAREKANYCIPHHPNHVLMSWRRLSHDCAKQPARRRSN